MSIRKPSAEEFSAEVDEDLQNVKLKIKAVEHCLKGGKSDPSADIHDFVPIYITIPRESIVSILQQLQDKENTLLQMKLDIGKKGMAIHVVIISLIYCI